MSQAGYLTTTEAASYIRSCDETVRRLIRSGQLRAVRVGRVWRTRVDWLDDCLLSKYGRPLRAPDSAGSADVVATAVKASGRRAH